MTTLQHQYERKRHAAYAKARNSAYMQLVNRHRAEFTELLEALLEKHGYYQLKEDYDNRPRPSRVVK